MYLIQGTPFGRVPVLEVDGTKIAGSINILRFLGKRFGKYPYSEFSRSDTKNFNFFDVIRNLGILA